MTECKLELPYKLIDTGFGDERFILSLKRISGGRTVSCDFEVRYKSRGIEGCFECDLTPSDIYCFYIQLDDVYDINSGKNSVAVLERGDRTKLIFKFDSRAKCTVSGSFRTKQSAYKSGVFFEDMQGDMTDIPRIDAAMKKFFDEIKRIKGADTWVDAFM